MTKSKNIATYLLVLVLALSCIVTGFAFSPKATAEETENTAVTVQGITYNSADFTVTKDTGATVDMGVWYDYDYNGTELDQDHEQSVLPLNAKGRLDEGKTGLLFTSVASGDDAEGKSITLANKQMGDFSMDFRVFSQKSYLGYGVTFGARTAGNPDSWNYSVFNDRYNPFLDMRGMDIKFTSVSNPEKYFILHLYGNSVYRAADVDAWVEVAGDEVTTAGRKGYGIDNGGGGRYSALGQKTWASGTTFSNATSSSLTSSTAIKFDAEKMSVYIRDINEVEQGNQGGGGARYDTSWAFIRNLQYNGLTDQSRQSVTDKGAKLSPNDFAAGYTVEISVADMTSNDTPLKKAVRDTSYTSEGLDDTSKANPSVYSGAREEFYDVDGDGTLDESYTYDRYANFIIYDINGAEMSVKDGWTATETTLTTNNMTTTADWVEGIPYTKGTTLKGIKYTANAKDEGAVGEGFTLDPNDYLDTDGRLNLKIAPTFTTRAPVAYNTSKLGMFQVSRSLGVNYSDFDQYSDMRHYSMTFRSTVDPTQALILNVMSNSQMTSANAIYALVEKDANYCQNSGVQGGGISSNTYGTEATGGANAEGTKKATGTPDSWGLLGGTMGAKGDVAYATLDDSGRNISVFELDPTTMTVYAHCNRDYKMVGRFDTTTPGGSGTYNYYNQKSALDPADFIDTNGNHTYDIEINVVRMNTKDSYGGDGTYYYYSESGVLSKAYRWSDNGNHNLTEGYERVAEFNIFKITDTTESDYAFPTSKITAKTASTGKSELSLGDIAELEIGSNATINAGVYNTFGKLSTPTTLTYSGPTSGTLNLTDGVAQFSPTVLGTYTFTDGVHTRRIKVIDSIVPTATFAPSLKDTYSHNEITVGLNDIVASDNFDSAVHSEYTIYKNGRVVNKIDELGEYTVRYTVIDSSNNRTSIERTITVVDDIVPTVGFKNYQNKYAVGDTVSLPVAGAYDAFDESPLISYTVTHNGKAVTVVNGSFVAKEAGVYEVSAVATDINGNKSETATARITVVAPPEDNSGVYITAILIGVPVLLALAVAVFAIIRFTRKKA